MGMSFPERETSAVSGSNFVLVMTLAYGSLYCGRLFRENPVRPITRSSSSLSQAEVFPGGGRETGKFPRNIEAVRRERWTAAAGCDCQDSRRCFCVSRDRVSALRAETCNDGYPCSVLTPCTPSDLSLSPVRLILKRPQPRGRRFLFTLLIVRSYLAMWILPMILARCVDNHARRFPHCRAEECPASRSHLPKIRNQIRESIIAI